MSKAADLFNAMNMRERTISAYSATESLINQIRLDQDKAKAAHAKFMRETNQHMENHKKWLIKLEKELEAVQ